MNHDHQIAQRPHQPAFEFQGLERVPLEEAEAGDIDYFRYRRHRYRRDHHRQRQPKGLPMLSVDEPTLTMDFMVKTPARWRVPKANS